MKTTSAIGFYPHGALTFKVWVNFEVDYDSDRPSWDRESLGRALSFEIIDRVPARILKQIEPEILDWADNQPLDSWDFESADCSGEYDEVDA